MFLLLLQVRVEDLVPRVGHPGHAPVDAVGVGGRVGPLRGGQQLAAGLGVDGDVRVDAVLRELRHVEQRDGHPHPGQHAGHHLHHPPVRAAAPVSPPLDGPRLVVAPDAAGPAPPVLAPQVRGGDGREEDAGAGGGLDVGVHPVGPCLEAQVEGDPRVQLLVPVVAAERTPHRLDPAARHPPHVAVEHQDVRALPVLGVQLDGVHVQHAAVGA
ncbi:hypothetical protein U9M48_007092 [Paspalum notatum var. saurae]|uniref:Uncharacterized protein n=1 Tax=Paspalum notatum var. saurae TaxID=547442 RepID=A0AAQ3Q0Y7_PASNO